MLRHDATFGAGSKLTSDDIEMGLGEEDKVKDNKDAKGATKKGPKVKAARIWAYSEPEYPVLAFGGFIALANGCVFPSIAFVFAEMLALFYSHDTDYIMDTALHAWWNFLCNCGHLVVPYRYTGRRVRSHWREAHHSAESSPFQSDPASRCGILRRSR